MSKFRRFTFAFKFTWPIYVWSLYFASVVISLTHDAYGFVFLLIGPVVQTVFTFVGQAVVSKHLKDTPKVVSEDGVK